MWIGVRRDVEPGRQFHSGGLRQCRSDLLQQFETFICKRVGPPAHLSLDVALASHTAELEADLSELLESQAPQHKRLGDRLSESFRLTAIGRLDRVLEYVVVHARPSYPSFPPGPATRR
jgi:hypothetical protein